MREIQGSKGYYINRDGIILGRAGATLKTQIDKKGYERVKLGRRSVKVHRVVAIAFIDNPHNYPQVNHINGIKSDNRVDNLEWCNNSQNQIHAYKTGLASNKGENHPRATVSSEDVKMIRFLISKGLKSVRLASEFKTSVHVISDIKRNKNWSHV
jgi:hypothetical protein